MCKCVTLLPPSKMSLLTRIVLLLALAALDTQAAPGPDCDVLNRTLPAEHLHTVYGDWVLVWAVTDDPDSLVLMRNLLTSHVELQPLPHNSTVTYTEKNLFRDKSCNRYFKNMTLNSDPIDSNRRTFHAVTGTLEKNGGVEQLNVTADIIFFESCHDCLMVNYRGSVGHFLLSYRRKGHHQDVEQQKASHSDYQKLSECLKLPHDEPYIYGGASDFCH